MVVYNNILAGASGATGDAGPYEISKSLRFNSGDSGYLNRTPSSAGNRRTWTWSGWVKKSTLTGNTTFFSAGSDGSNRSHFMFDGTTHALRYFDLPTSVGIITKPDFRDTSAWYHIVLAADTTQSTASNRIKIYVNGVQVTSFSSSNYPSQNAELQVNRNAEHALGRGNTYHEYFDGYLADVHFIDGQALAATDFGESDDNKVWQPKAYSGSYGTNGFQLDFNDNTTNQALGYDASVNSPAVNNRGGFDAVTYTGTNSTQTIKSLAFQPDLIWFKARSYGGSHALVDSVRGISNQIQSNTSNAESTNPAGAGPQSLNSDGFTLGTESNATGSTNGSGQNYVAFAWKAGGTASSNTDGSITSSVSADNTYGFSVVSYAGATGAQTVGHGLSSAPKFIIAKNRDSSSDWIVYHESLDSSNPEDKFLRLNQTNATTTSADYWGSGGVTNSVFGVDNGILINTNAEDVIAYCWSEVSGYSKFGSYTGTGASGVSVTTGFKPRWVMLKETGNAGNWFIYDSVRGTTNILWANTSDSESSIGAGDGTNQNRLDITDTGFTIPHTLSGTNRNGGTYVYAAFGDRAGNNWTPNNLVATAADYAATGSDPSNKIIGGTTIQDFWDGSTSTYMQISQGAYVVMTDGGSTAIGTASTNVGFYTANGASTATLRINGTSVFQATSTTLGWFDFNFTGPIYKVEVGYLGGSGSGNSFYAFRIDGNTLIGDSSSNIDSLIDTPTNYEADSGNNGGNYATMSPVGRTKSAYFTENGNLTCGNSSVPSGSSGSRGYIPSTIGFKSGKWYCEVQTTAASDGDVDFAIGLWLQNSTGYYSTGGSVTVRPTGHMYSPAGLHTSWGSTWTDNDVIGIAVDMDSSTKTVQFFKNGTSMASATTIADKEYFFGYGSDGGGSGRTYKATWNFGQRPFAHTPPTGYKSLCTTNLPDPTIADGSTAFDTKLYTGNSSTQNITGLNFNPDFLWIKSRSSPSSGQYHHLLDSVRGKTSGFFNSLYSNTTEAENTYPPSTKGGVTAFNNDGFSLSNVGSETFLNQSSNTYVAWAWDAGSSTVSNTDGTITSNVCANPTAGFSIVSFTSATGTIGHGLNAAPHLIIAKRTDAAYEWATFWHDLGTNKAIVLDKTNAAYTYSNIWGSAMPTSSVFSFNTANIPSGGSAIAYCFAPVEGYSAMGSYSGFSASVGPFIYTGFAPKFVILKSSTHATDWCINDIMREENDPGNARLSPNLSNAEVSDSSNDYRVDFLSNGFQLRGDNTAQNTTGRDYIYMAFASHPFKTARAR